MRNLNALILVQFFLSTFLFSSIEISKWEWVNGIIDGDNFMIHDHALDSEQNLFITGQYAGKLKIGSSELTSVWGSWDAFVAKMDSSGNWVWAVSAGGNNYYDEGNAITVGSDGKIYVVGRYSWDASQFVGFNIDEPSYSKSRYIACLNQNGQWEWARDIGGYLSESIQEIDVSAGLGTEIYVVGNRYDENSGAMNGIVGEFCSETKSWSWIKGISDSSSHTACNTVHVDQNGKLWVGGNFSGSVSFGSQSFSNSSASDLFVSRLGSDGAFEFTVVSEGDYGDTLTGIVTDNDGNAYIVGYFNGDALFGESDVQSGVSDSTIFVAKIGSDGNWKWANDSSGVWEEGLGISLGSDGNPCIIGFFPNDLTLGKYKLSPTPRYHVNAGAGDVLIAKLDSSRGEWIRVVKVGGDGTDKPDFIFSTTDHKFLVGGSFHRTIDFSNYTLSSTSEKPGYFVGKFNFVSALNDINDDGISDLLLQSLISGSITGIAVDSSAEYQNGVTSILKIPTYYSIIGGIDFDNNGILDYFGEDKREKGRFTVLIGDEIGEYSTDITVQLNDPEWQLVGIYDQNNDSNKDFVWQNLSSGKVLVWYLDEAANFVSSLQLVKYIDEWRIITAGDVDEDGYMDLLWQKVDSTAQQTKLSVWLLDSSGKVKSGGYQNYGPLSDRWRGVGLADYNIDGHLDLVWQNLDSYKIVSWNLDGSGTVSSNTVLSQGESGMLYASWQWELGAVGVEPADENGDGKADLLWQNRSTGKVLSWRYDGSWNQAYHTVVNNNQAPGTLVALADMNNDGSSDLVWSDVAGGSIIIRVWLMNSDYTLNNSYQAAVLADTWTLVGIGDINGDGNEDLVWQQSGTGKTVSWNQDGAGNTTSYTTIISSLSGFDLWMVEDMNGDGNDDLIWRKNQTTNYKYILWFMDGTGKAESYATLTQLPVAWTLGALGDFDEDGNVDAVWYNESSGKAVAWMLNSSNRALSYKTVGAGLSAWRLMHW